MSKTQLLYDAYDVPDRDLDEYECPPGTTCAITGEEITCGVEADSILTNASSAPHEIFPNATSDYVSWEAAQCYKHFRGGLTGNLLAITGPPGAERPSAWGYKPMVSASSASSKDRPCWQSVIYGTDDHVTLEKGMPCLAVFTEEHYRRLWIEAELSTTGPHWKPYFYSGTTVRALAVEFSTAQDVLGLCEYVYSLGFTKEQIRTSLTGAISKMDLITELGPTRVQTLDEAVASYRGTDELRLATFVCQRASIDVSDSFTDQIEALEAPKDHTCLIPTPQKTTSPPASTTAPATTSSEPPTRQKEKTESGDPQMGLFS